METAPYLLYTHTTMPGLSSSLRAFDQDQLEQIARFWAVPLSASSKESTRLSLELALPDRESFVSLFESLPEEARQALMALKANGGQMSWSAFSLRYGEIRGMGPAKRKKEQPWAFPTSVSELLWYRGLIGRDFLRLRDELEEQAYLPDEFIPLLPEVAPNAAKFLIRLQPQRVLSAEPRRNMEILNHICTLLAALRFEDADARLGKTNRDAEYWRLLRALLGSVGILDSRDAPTELARSWLEMPRPKALAWLQNEWAKAPGFNEFDFISDLEIRSPEPIATLNARQILLAALQTLAVRQWFSLDELAGQLRDKVPELLRDQEQFSAWKVVNRQFADHVLIGLESWQAVEGAFVRFVVSHLMPMLGMAAVTPSPDDPDRLLFQLLPNLESDFDLPSAEAAESCLRVHSSGKISMTDRSPLFLRYNVSRFCEWIDLGETNFTYQLTPESLRIAGQNGLQPRHLISLLRKHSQTGLPPTLFKALKRWESEGRQAKIENVTVLQLASPAILQALRDTPASRWLDEALGPSAVTIKPGGIEAVQSALASLGYLCDLPDKDKNER